VLIKNLYLLKGYGSWKLLTEFPEKNGPKQAYFAKEAVKDGQH